MKFILIVVVALLSISNAAVVYNVTFTRVNGQIPVINSQKGQSSFRYNYNAAVVPLSGQKSNFGLLVRSQNQADPNNPWSVTSSVFPYTALNSPFNINKLTFDPIKNSSVVFQPEGDEENYGVEDPRVVYRAKTGEYYMYYTAAQSYPNGTVIARLALVTSKTPWLKGSWKRRGLVFPQEYWTKSAALLIRDDIPNGLHYLYFGDSSIKPGLQVAASKDLITWHILPGIWLPLRKNSFDSTLVEAGPHPLPLSDGNLLLLYNSARAGFPSPRPGYDLQYNVGWLVLDKNDPTKILARSESPILSPELDWEVGNPPYLGLVPRVVFLEGWMPLPGSDNKFLAFYGGADVVLGAGIVSVAISKS